MADTLISTHVVVLRPFNAVGYTAVPGEILDATSWRSLGRLINSRHVSEYPYGLEVPEPIEYEGRTRIMLPEYSRTAGEDLLSENEDEEGEEASLPLASAEDLLGYPGSAATIAKIMNWVSNDPDKAAIALDEEMSREDPRSSLMARLEIIAGDEG